MARDFSELRIIHYPDPRLRTPCAPVTAFDDELAALAARMHALMREARGVGLAAPQVGVNLRLFVMNVTQEPQDALTFVNPQLVDLEGGREASEGCLSIPDVHVTVRRATRCRMEAQDVAGRPIRLAGEDLTCRVWQHETDHLNGVLILDRMGPGDRLATRRQLRELEEAYREFHESS